MCKLVEMKVNDKVIKIADIKEGIVLYERNDVVNGQIQADRNS